mmetsp:Transcript_17688/g.28625  ORF Transcript_17688/g.28625 Transcript_17688/m.28625 type:complete len:155 (-) Transcript_17688:184-648(-)
MNESLLYILSLRESSHGQLEAVAAMERVASREDGAGICLGLLVWEVVRAPEQQRQRHRRGTDADVSRPSQARVRPQDARGKGPACTTDEVTGVVDPDRARAKVQRDELFDDCYTRHDHVLPRDVGQGNNNETARQPKLGQEDETNDPAKKQTGC